MTAWLGQTDRWRIVLDDVIGAVTHPPPQTWAESGSGAANDGNEAAASRRGLLAPRGSAGKRRPDEPCGVL
jgi:hypothetical protein